MALKPPARAGSSGSIGRGIFRRGRRLGEMLVKQSTGGARAVLADWVLASAASDNKTGSVTGSTTFSGTIVGRKATTGAVAGTVTLTGTIVGKEGEPGAVSGVITYSGTIVGKRATQGSVAASITYSGVITGTAFDPDAPTGTAPTGGMSAYRRAQIAAANLAALEAQQPQVEHKTGSVRGVIAYRGTVVGRRGTSGRTLTAPITYRAHVHGTKSTRGAVLARIETRARITGTGITAINTSELRRLRDDAELLLLI